MKPLLEIADEYRLHRLALNYSMETLETDEERLRLFFRWLENKYGITTPDRINNFHLEDYQRHLSTRSALSGKRLPLKPGTINTLIVGVRGFLQYSGKKGYSPLNLVEVIKYVKTPKMLPVSVLDHDEMKKILKSIPSTTPLDYRNKTICNLLYSCGLRNSELVGLRIKDIDSSNGILRAFGKRKERMVPIGQASLRYLQTYLNAVRPMWCRSQETDILFLSRTGQPLDHSALGDIVIKYFSNASVRTTPHTFRRSSTTELVRGNANLYHVKEMLGHQSLATLTPYTKLTIRDIIQMHSRFHPSEKDHRKERG